MHNCTKVKKLCIGVDEFREISMVVRKASCESTPGGASEHVQRFNENYIVHQVNGQNGTDSPKNASRLSIGILRTAGEFSPRAGTDRLRFRTTFFGLSHSTTLSMLHDFTRWDAFVCASGPAPDLRLRRPGTSISNSSVSPM